MPIKLPVHVIKMDGGFARLQGADFWISHGVLDSAEAIQIADALNNAARYRETLEKAYKELDPALFFSAIGYMAAACRMRSDIGAALADAGKGGGE